MSHSKRYRAARQQVDPAKRYPLTEAIAVAKSTSTVKFDAGIELHIRLGVDAKKADQAVRGTVKLPHGTGKKLSVAVFATGKAADAAKAAGADPVGGSELIKTIKETGATDFDLAVATPDMMKQLAPIAKILGTRGLMPNPKNETISVDPAAAVAELMGGKIAFRCDDTGNVHALIGRVSFSDEQLIANATTLLEAVKKAKPSESKGTYLLGASVASTMGPAVKVDPSA